MNEFLWYAALTIGWFGIASVLLYDARRRAQHRAHPVPARRTSTTAGT